jgi:hypothetical protein
MVADLYRKFLPAQFHLRVYGHSKRVVIIKLKITTYSFFINIQKTTYDSFPQQKQAYEETTENRQEPVVCHHGKK